MSEGLRLLYIFILKHRWSIERCYMKHGNAVVEIYISGISFIYTLTPGDKR